MPGSKSTQTRDNCISTIHLYACFLMGAKITSSNAIESN